MSRDDSLHSAQVLARELRARIGYLADCVDSSLTVRELVAVAYEAGAKDADDYIGASTNTDSRVYEAGERLRGAFAMLHHPSAVKEDCDA